VELLRQAVPSINDLPEAWHRLQQRAPQALLQVVDYVTQQGFDRLAQLALDARLPLVGVDPVFAGVLAGRVLAGASPADLPFERPGAPQRWLNPLTARRLGLALPATVLARAVVVQGPAAAATSCG